jgi:hypothetical protein
LALALVEHKQDTYRELAFSRTHAFTMKPNSLILTALVALFPLMGVAHAQDVPARVPSYTATWSDPAPKAPENATLGQAIAMLMPATKGFYALVQGPSLEKRVSWPSGVSRMEALHDVLEANGLYALGGTDYIKIFARDTDASTPMQTVRIVARYVEAPVASTPSVAGSPTAATATDTPPATTAAVASPATTAATATDTPPATTAAVASPATTAATATDTPPATTAAVASPATTAATATDTPPATTAAVASPATTAAAAPEVWEIKKGEHISEALKAWAKSAGWVVEWNLSKDWVSPQNTRFTGDFESAAASAVRALASNGADIRAVFYSFNQTVAIRQAGN